MYVMLSPIAFLSKLVFPRKCLLCKKMTPSGLCPACQNKVPFLVSPYCDLCGRPFLQTTISHRCGTCLTHPDRVYHRSAVIYHPPVTSLIYQLKYGADFSILELLAGWLNEKCAELIRWPDVIIPVPLSRQKMAQRGFNQSLELAKILAAQNKKQLLSDSLLKIKDTPSQTSLSLSERETNLKGAFQWKGGLDLQSKKVLLVDDVHSTGSTLKACAKALSQGQPQQIQAVTVAYNAKGFLPKSFLTKSFLP